jgi:hypothetical protein
MRPDPCGAQREPEVVMDGAADDRRERERGVEHARAQCDGAAGHDVAHDQCTRRHRVAVTLLVREERRGQRHAPLVDQSCIAVGEQVTLVEPSDERARLVGIPHVVLVGEEHCVDVAWRTCETTTEVRRRADAGPGRPGAARVRIAELRDQHVRRCVARIVGDMQRDIDALLCEHARDLETQPVLAWRMRREHDMHARTSHRIGSVHRCTRARCRAMTSGEHGAAPTASSQPVTSRPSGLSRRSSTLRNGRPLASAERQK